MSGLSEQEVQPCPECIKTWGQTPNPWGDSVQELDAHREHLEKHEGGGGK